MDHKEIALQLTIPAPAPQLAAKQVPESSQETLRRLNTF